MRVFQYEISEVDEAKVRLPLGAQVLSAGRENDKLFLCALVDPGETRTKQRIFRIAGTGDEIAEVEELDFIASVQSGGDASVLHIFERISAF